MRLITVYRRLPAGWHLAGLLGSILYGVCMLEVLLHLCSVHLSITYSGWFCLSVQSQEGWESLPRSGHAVGTYRCCCLCLLRFTGLPQSCEADQLKSFWAWRLAVGILGFILWDFPGTLGSVTCLLVLSAFG